MLRTRIVLFFLLLTAFTRPCGAAEFPSLIPAPANVTQRPGSFDLGMAVRISIQGPSLQAAARYLNGELFRRLPVMEEASLQGGKAVRVPVVHDSIGVIRLQLDGDHEWKSAAAYKLEVNAEGILLTGASPRGVFYGLQTLLQLMQNGEQVPACSISDSPAFAWRGMMHDLGRNFIPMDELKEQIDVMARYKLNIFHLHLTEDIAWRIGLQAYPELTAASNMRREPGMYYTLNELKELVRYCRERYITLVPEIDMPGHSGAFERAFGTGMQTEEGKDIVRNILGLVAGELDVPYFHIGGDEVRITDTAFLPEMSRLLRDKGKEVIGWLPGGNLDGSFLRQLWTGRPVPPAGTRVIDSRHLYLNHSDPLGGVVKMFNRQFCDTDRGDSLLLGAEMCIWPDRRPYDPKQIMQMNAVYPILLAFAERAWKGGGFPGYSANLGSEGSRQLEAFRGFEGRLLEHKRRYFKDKSFPYVKQGHALWKIAGPYDNGGNLEAAFAPETDRDFWETGTGRKPDIVREVIGSTIWLRHFFSPYLKGHLPKPRENSTCYAYAEVYSPEARDAEVWISFHNPSRSENDDTAPAGGWDYKKSRIWLNGAEIRPPRWSKPGRKGEKEAPYLDESFELRAPHRVKLKEGWNKLLLKLPVEKFSTPHTRLVKWMFTVAFLKELNYK